MRVRHSSFFPSQRHVQHHQILVVDDDPNIIAFLRRALIYEGYGVKVASDGRAALEEARQSLPDLVILDVMLPKIDGLEICRRLRDGDQDLPVLMLTARDTIGDRVVGLDAGADDYLVKPFALEELLARVRALLRRRAPRGDQSLRFADLTLDPLSREVRRNGRDIVLTAKEFDLLYLFMRHPRQVLSHDYLLREIWHMDTSMQTNVLEVYVGYLRQKLEQQGEQRLLHTVRNAGYVLRT